MPSFSESQYGFKSFKQLLEAAEANGFIKLTRDKSDITIEINQLA